jgi:hypothetical protein
MAAALGNGLSQPDPRHLPIDVSHTFLGLLQQPIFIHGVISFAIQLYNWQAANL